MLFRLFGVVSGCFGSARGCSGLLRVVQGCSGFKVVWGSGFEVWFLTFWEVHEV